MQAEKTKFIYKESPGERTYMSSFYYVLRKKGGNRKDFGYFRSFWARLMVQLLFLS